MFTTGKIIFAICFIIVFITLMVFSYKKDTSRHKIHYKNAAKKVALYGLLVIIIFALIRYVTNN